MSCLEILFVAQAFFFLIYIYIFLFKLLLAKQAKQETGPK